ncbi:hypothetical protein JB92DRAFT_2834462 [Gautieria morchelliformis]|nr:hypothetical protein JB92DRAFT_2834462 [Gautieria morchelliformis]
MHLFGGVAHLTQITDVLKHLVGVNGIEVTVKNIDSIHIANKNFNICQGLYGIPDAHEDLVNTSKTPSGQKRPFKSPPAYSMPVTCRLGMGEARSRCGSIARLLKIDDNPYSQTSLGHVSSLERVAAGGMWMGMVLASLPGWLSTENYVNFCSHARNYVATVNYVTRRAGRRRYQHFGFFLMVCAAQEETGGGRGAGNKMMGV